MKYSISWHTILLSLTLLFYNINLKTIMVIITYNIKNSQLLGAWQILNNITL